MNDQYYEGLIKRLDYLCKKLKEPQPSITRPYQSEQLDKLIPALFQAQQEVAPMIKDAKGQHSKYCTITAVLKASQPILFQNGLYMTDFIEEGIFVCKLIHCASQQYMESRAPVMLEDPRDPQSLGSCQTYFRRYLRVAFLGMTAEDDDGQRAKDGPPTPEAK